MHSLNTIHLFLPTKTGRFAPLFFLVDGGLGGIELPLEKNRRAGAIFRGGATLAVQTT